MGIIDKFSLIGIYGGTFDPIHYGHLRIAEELLDLIDLKQVIFVPAGVPRLRVSPVASKNHRAAMLRLATQDNPFFSIDEREINRSGSSVTVHTLSEYRNELSDNAALCFILGIDAFVKIHQWIEWQKLFELCHLIVVARPGYAVLPDNQALPVEIQKEFSLRNTACAGDLSLQANGYIYLAQTSLLDISASQIRSFLNAGKSIRYLLPENVSDYIKSNRLYI
ncbi:MAG: nicotinate-nucleotide adenylyltransferase [Nitrosomonas sp. PRO4]|nr:nicotinate-nucleotide adenylyltransferase [Nitrosomonas sp. PRO4]